MFPTLNGQLHRGDSSDAVGVRSAVHQLGEHLQGLAGLHRGAAEAAKIDCVAGRPLRRGERFGRVVQLTRSRMHNDLLTVADGRDARLPTSIGSEILLRRESTAGDIRIH